MNCPIRTLDNGVRVVAAPLKERRSTAIGVWVHTGARDEDARTSGVSHFLEHVVFKGTKRRTAAEIKEGVEGLGGSLNAFTSEEYTCFLAKCTSRHFEKVFDVLADMVLNASLQEKDIRKERTVILEEIKMTQDQPSQWVDELVAELTWEGHALARPVAGSMQSVSGLTTDDIRYAAGGGVRYTSLIGVMRADMGFQLNPIPDLRVNGAPQKRTWRIHLSIGHAF